MNQRFRLHFSGPKRNFKEKRPTVTAVTLSAKSSHRNRDFLVSLWQLLPLPILILKIIILGENCKTIVRKLSEHRLKEAG